MKQENFGLKEKNIASLYITMNSTQTVNPNPSSEAVTDLCTYR